MTRPLADHRLSVSTSTAAGRHAARLFAMLGARVDEEPAPRSGGSGVGPPAAPAGRWEPDRAARVAMAGATSAIRTLGAMLGHPLDLDGPALLERGPAAGPGPRSDADHPVGGGHGARAHGGARTTAAIVWAADGPLAVNLPRRADWDLVAAWLGTSAPGPTSWDEIAAVVAQRPRRPLAARAGELGIAAAPCPAAGSQPVDEQTRHRHPRGTIDPWVLRSTGRAGRRRRTADDTTDLRVLDLSALWAGPLLGWILAGTGASVTKVEDPRRPDVSRERPSELAVRLNQPKQPIDVPFSADGRNHLHALVADADIVIEASRPRALDHLGLGPETGLRSRQIWVSITAHGRTGPWRNRPGYGDDCAAAGGLYRDDGGPPRFAGDALADPLTGVHGAVAVLAGLVGGWSGHVDLALRDTAATVARIADP